MPLETYLSDFDPEQEIACAWTPPSSWYTEPGFLKAELRKVFYDHWLYLGPVSAVENPGDYATYELVGQPLVVTRDRGGALRAFYNVCRHHAACVASGQGNAELLICPYHGWAYRLDGSLRKAPRLGRLENFDVREFGLKPVRLEVWGGLMFVHLGAPACSVAAGRLKYLRRGKIHDVEELFYGDLKLSSG